MYWEVMRLCKCCGDFVTNWEETACLCPDCERLLEDEGPASAADTAGAAFFLPLTKHEPITWEEANYMRTRFPWSRN